MILCAFHLSDATYIETYSLVALHRLDRSRPSLFSHCRNLNLQIPNFWHDVRSDHSHKSWDGKSFKGWKPCSTILIKKNCLKLSVWLKTLFAAYLSQQIFFSAPWSTGLSLWEDKFRDNEGSCYHTLRCDLWKVNNISGYWSVDSNTSQFVFMDNFPTLLRLNNKFWKRLV